jgi:hypothetical protein
MVRRQSRAARGNSRFVRKSAGKDACPTWRTGYWRSSVVQESLPGPMWSASDGCDKWGRHPCLPVLGRTNYCHTRLAVVSDPGGRANECIPDPGGIAACSRWLSAFCETTGHWNRDFAPRQGCQRFRLALLASTPAGVRKLELPTGGVANYAQPPATCGDPSIVHTFSGIRRHFAQTFSGIVNALVHTLSAIRKWGLGLILVAYVAK